jgi:hypothetical protein
VALVTNSARRRVLGWSGGAGDKFGGQNLHGV